MEFLFWSQVIFWFVMLVYAFYLIANANNIEKQLESLDYQKKGKDNV